MTIPELSQQSDEFLNRSIAERMGWRQRVHGKWSRTGSLLEIADHPPNYAQDLNAMAEAELFFWPPKGMLGDPMPYLNYIGYLYTLIVHGTPTLSGAVLRIEDVSFTTIFKCSRATARQRALAFILATEKGR